MAGGSNRFLYSKYSRIIFLKQHSFKTRFSIPSLPMYMLHEVLLPLKLLAYKCTGMKGKVCCKGQFYLSEAKLSINNKVDVFFLKISFLW